MPSARQQFGIRLADEDVALLHDLARRIRERTGLDTTHTDVFRLGLRELAKRYPADGEGADREAEGKPRRRGKGK